jgi:uncharacterized protein YjiS (DUF1127 family)
MDNLLEPGCRTDTGAGAWGAVLRALGAAARIPGAVVRGIAREHARGAMIRQLAAIDDRTLGDIGLERGQIPVVVDALLEADVARPRPGRRVGSAPEPPRRPRAFSGTLTWRGDAR